MATTNRPDRVIIDSYSDLSIETNATGGLTSVITNNLDTPLLHVKGIQLNRANFVNSVLQLNDQTSLMFFYYKYTDATSAGIAVANMRCIRLLPSNYVPKASFTAFTQNKYFNTTAELVAQLNVAASTGGDNVTYNPTWLVNDVLFSYDATTSRITFTGQTASSFYSVAASDDPNIKTFLASSSAPKMNGFTSSSTYATATAQPYTLGQTMNSRLGFAMGYNNRGIWWGSSSVKGCATLTGVPQANAVGVLADSWPILLGSQNVNVYLDVAVGSGLDSRRNKNLLACIPLEAPSLAVCSYTLISLEYPALSVPPEIYSLTISLQDDFGNPFIIPANYNANFELSILY